jgi:hypothetical protein
MISMGLGLVVGAGWKLFNKSWKSLDQVGRGEALGDVPSQAVTAALA